MLPSGFLAHILPPSIDSCWLGFRFHSSPRTLQALPFPPFGLHPSAQKRSPVRSGYSDCLSSLRLMAYRPLLLVRALSPRARLGLSIAAPFGIWSASLALPTSGPNMPSADFCPAVRPPFDN